MKKSKPEYASVLELDQLFTLCGHPCCTPENIQTLIETVNFNSAALNAAIDILNSNEELAQNPGQLKLCRVILSYAIVLNSGRIIKV